MTSYSEQSGNSAAYGKEFPGESVWDLGLTEWDISGNVAQTHWDVSAATSYSIESGDTPTWNEQ